jgi:hypothetical protein
MVWVKSVGSAETQLTRSDRRREEGRMGFPLMINRRLTPQIRYNSILRGVNTTACHTEEATDIRWVPHILPDTPENFWTVYWWFLHLAFLNGRNLLAKEMRLHDGAQGSAAWTCCCWLMCAKRPSCNLVSLCQTIFFTPLLALIGQCGLKAGIFSSTLDQLRAA